jgi:hypothetical protein
MLATICVRKKYKRLGRFDSALQAALKYDEAAIKYHCEFACTNKMLGLL